MNQKIFTLRIRHLNLCDAQHAEQLQSRNSEQWISLSISKKDDFQNNENRLLFYI